MFRHIILTSFILFSSNACNKNQFINDVSTKVTKIFKEGNQEKLIDYLSETVVIETGPLTLGNFYRKDNYQNDTKGREDYFFAVLFNTQRGRKLTQEKTFISIHQQFKEANKIITEYDDQTYFSILAQREDNSHRIHFKCNEKKICLITTFELDAEEYK